MGAAESTNVLGSYQELLSTFVGTDSVPYDSPFWNDLLSFPYPLSKLKPVDLDEATKGLCSDLIHNNYATSHFPKLLLHLVRSLEELPSVVQKLPLKTVNAVYFTRLFVKHLVEFYDSMEIQASMYLVLSEAEAKSSSLHPGEQDVLVATVRALLSFIGNFDVNPNTYLLHLEVVSLLLVMASTQLHCRPGSASGESHIFLDSLMAQDDISRPFVRKLLVAYMARLPMPTRAPFYIPGVAGDQGVFRKVGSAAAAVFLLPYYTYTYLINSSGSAVGSKSPLADSSLLLLLLLVHYGKVLPVDTIGLVDTEKNGEATINELARPVYQSNPFRTALQTARDTDFVIVRLQDRSEEAVRVPFAALYDTLGACLVDDRSTLLLYSLIHGNPAFLEYLLVRADLDTLLMPLLEMLYTASRRTPNQIYMLLIILLILSQDASFNANVHKLVLPGVPWYKERLLPRISLGSLMVVMLIRTVKYNLSKLRDVYLHTNCLATLANMAPHAHHLNAYASQRLISLFQMLAKKYMRLVDSNSALKNSTNGDGGQSDVEAIDDVPTELHIYTDFLRIVLEIINAVLTYALPRNPEVVYALLHRQEIFTPFRHHPRFYELLENIFTVVEFFNVRMDDHGQGGEWSVEKVLEVVVANARAWRGDGMKMFTELRFTYEEELHPEEFFIPYVWTLVVAHSGIPWNPDCITLFPVKPTAELDEVYDHDAFDTSSEYTPTPREAV